VLSAAAFFAVIQVTIATFAAFLFSVVFLLLSFGQYGYQRYSITSGDSRSSISMPVKSSRNVYVITSESLQSAKAYRELYGLSELPYINYLRNKGFRVLDSAYSAANATRTSYQRMLEFGFDLRTKEHFAGVLYRGNSTFNSFHDGGYKIQFMYRSNYLEINHDIVEYAFPPPGYYICDNLPANFMYVACLPAVVETINDRFLHAQPVSVERQIEILQERTKVAASGAPWLTVNHIAFPFHTGLDYRFNDDAARAEFTKAVRDALPAIEANYRAIMDSIIAVDPDAVILTFGDHGGWLTRGMPNSLPAPGAPFSKDEFIEDRYGITFAVYPADFCATRIAEGMTTTNIMRSVIQCLNGNDRPTAREIAEGFLISFGKLSDVRQLLGE
jgi:hypothetical protein